MDKISEDWYIDRSMKIILRRGSIFQRLLYWFYQIKLEELYDLIQIYLNKPDNMELLNIFERDTFVKPREYPRAYRILNGWQIKEASLKFIKNGPLVSERGSRILVKEKNIWRNIAIMLTIISFVFGIFGFLGITLFEPSKLFK